MALQERWEDALRIFEQTVDPAAGNLPSSGNYAGEELLTQPWWGTTNRLAGFRDRYVRTSPVGQFPANRHGFYDLGGNVQEWIDKDDVRDHSGSSQNFLRGGDWLTFEPDAMAINHEVALDVGATTETCGFRIVLEE